jgi:PhzF family phenazine biosynthesis protein
MELALYQIDAFASEVFKGNPAAVCPLEDFLSEPLMQAIAAENNLSETAFFVAKDHHYAIRWFTPISEIKLCGHATLASAFVIFNYLDSTASSLTFDSQSGPLYVKKLANGSIQLDFPAKAIEQVQPAADLIDALGIAPQEVYRSAQDYLVIYKNKEQILSVRPDLNKLINIDLRGVIVSSQAKDSDNCDFVSRFFAPKCGFLEDPVTGSAHCILTPYWSAKLGKNSLKAKQLSKRGGELLCELAADRVLIAGNAVLYMKGVINTRSL